MTSLYEYILEAAIGNIGITFDEFKSYVYEDQPNIDKIILDKFMQAFGKGGYSKYYAFREFVYEMIIQFNKMNVDVDDNIVHFMYDKFCSVPTSTVNRLVGAGAAGSAFEVNNKIIKVFYRSNIIPLFRRFYEYCLKHDSKYFPKVYRLGKNYVIMEKLKTNTSKIKKMFRILDASIPELGLTFYRAYKEDKLRRIQLTKEQQRIKDWLDGMSKELWENNLLDEGDLGDLKHDNLGEREDGTIVFFDI